MSNQGSENISMECNYPSKYVLVKGSRMHYIEAGSGDVVLFLHGMPASSYLWRNIIPWLSDTAHCIALDLIGMGESDKPEIEYRVFDHIEYVEGFINNLGLKNITLVMHGWGSVIGFDIASRHEEKFKALAFFEAHVRPVTDWSMLSLPVQQLASLLKRPGANYRAVVMQNYLIEKLLPNGTVRALREEELDHYRKPFSTPESRKLLWQYIQDLPLGKGPNDVVALMEHYCEWLQKNKLPKLMLYAIPGFITTIATVQWVKDHLPNCEIVSLDNVLHFAQESTPDTFGEKLRDWYLHLPTQTSVAVTN